MRCWTCELCGGDKLLGVLHASVAPPSRDLGCWFCSERQTPKSTAASGLCAAGQGCWTYRCALPWLGNQPIGEVCQFRDSCTQSPHNWSLLSVGNADRKSVGREGFPPSCWRSPACPTGTSKQLVPNPGHLPPLPPWSPNLPGSPVRRAHAQSTCWPPLASHGLLLIPCMWGGGGGGLHCGDPHTYPGSAWSWCVGPVAWRCWGSWREHGTSLSWWVPVPQVAPLSAGAVWGESHQPGLCDRGGFSPSVWGWPRQSVKSCWHVWRPAGQAGQATAGGQARPCGRQAPRVTGHALQRWHA